MRTAIGCLLVLLLAVPVFANPPINGTYKSTDLGGLMLTGRYTESWPAAGSGEPPALTNATNKMSWDGFTLGTQWWMYCAGLFNCNLVVNTVNAFGNGFKIYVCDYMGGLCILDGNGPWGDGSVANYTAVYDSYQETKTFQFVNFQITSVVCDVSLQATIIGYNDMCMEFTVSNQEEYGNTDSAALPANYPGFEDPNFCAPTRTLGSWGEVDDFTMTITGCTVPTEQSTWGNIKSLYTE